VWQRRNAGALGRRGTRHLLLPDYRWPGGRPGRQRDYQRAACRETPDGGAGRRQCAGRATSGYLPALPGLTAGADIAVALGYRARDPPGEAGCGDLPGPDALLERPGLYQP